MKEVMELALEALGEVYWSSRSAKHDEAITAIKEALAQDSKRPIESDYISQVAYTRALEAYCDGLAEPEQDWIERERAVGYREGHQNALKQMAQLAPVQQEQVEIVSSKAMTDADWDRLLKQPPQRKPLTDEQRLEVLTRFKKYDMQWHGPAILIDLVEAAHGIGEKT